MLGRKRSSAWLDDRQRVSLSIALLCALGLFVAFQAASGITCRFPPGGLARVVRTAAQQ